MKILMTADTLGGVWTYCMELCSALAPYEVTIALATMGRELSPEQRWQVKRLPHVELYESTYRLCWMQDSERDVEEAGRWLLALERRIKPDLVQLNDLAHGGLDWHAPVVLVGHSCVFSWWEAVNRELPPMDEWDHYHRLVSASVQSADLVLAPSNAMLKSLLRHYGPARNTSVIYNGRDFPPLAQGFSHTHPAPPRFRGARDPAGDLSGVPVTQALRHRDGFIFAAGRIWDQAKNVGLLSSIADELPWPVYAAGEQYDPNGGCNIPDGVNCLGFLNSDEMAQWLKRASIYVAPAHYEPFGLSVLEAARTGCALVLGDIPSLREVWGDAAEYVDPDDPSQLRELLTALSENPLRCRRMGERAWQRAKRYTASRMAENYMQWYRYIVKNVTQHKARSGNPMSGARA